MHTINAMIIAPTVTRYYCCYCWARKCFSNFISYIHVYHTRRWDEDVYCRQKAHTLTSIKEKSKLGKKPCSQHLGSVRPPLVNVEPSHIVLDERLPELMPSFLPEDLCPSVARLWTVSAPVSKHVTMLCERCRTSVSCTKSCPAGLLLQLR